MKIYIIDASVILKTMLGEDEKTIKAFTLILNKIDSGKIQLYSTQLLVFEVGNGLRFSLKDESLSKEAMEKFLNLPIKYFTFTKNQNNKILELSYQQKTTFYDTSYHFLARTLNGIFLTADREYYQKASKAGFIKLV